MDANSPTSKKTNLYILLSSFFLGNAILAELTGAKIFNVGKLLQGWLGTGMPSFTFSMNMSIGVMIWPLVFITSDIMNEYFGRVGVRKVSFITAGLIAYASLFLIAANKLPPADFWLRNNAADPAGNPFDINFAYNSVFRQGVNIIAGSLIAFLVSQLVDVYTFQYFKNKTGHRYLWLRATGSTVISQVIDSFLILFVAFYWLGNWSFDQVLKVGVVQYIYKVSLAIILTPVIYLMHGVIDAYMEGRMKPVRLKGFRLKAKG
jgi:queuosine precursor transporter